MKDDNIKVIFNFKTYGNKTQVNKVTNPKDFKG